jgi:hypothetical protein
MFGITGHSGHDLAGRSIDIYESEQNGYPYVIKMEQNKEKNLWKITEF